MQALSGAQGTPQASQVQVPGAAVMAGKAAQQKLARLTDAAQRFEGMMMQELLKPLEDNQSGGMWGGEDDPDRDSSLDTMSSYGTEAVANALAAHGGMGIAKQVVAQVTRLDQQMHRHGGTAHSDAAHGETDKPSSGDSGQHPLASVGSLRASFGRAGEPISEKEQKGTAQVLKFGVPPPMR